MVEIYYHPLNPKNPFFHSGGVKVSLDEFLAKDNLWMDSKDSEKIVLDTCNPLHSTGLLDYMSVAIRNISGHLPSKADRRKIGSFLQQIKEGIKKGECHIKEKIASPEFILGSLPYMFIGFDMDFNTNIPHSGHNTLASAYQVGNILCREEKIEISSLLCAHKARRSVNRNGLIENLSFTHVQKVLNLMGGIIDNSPAESSRFIFYQPGGNLRDIHFVFPPLLHKYYYEGRINEMLEKLDEHLISMQKYLTYNQTLKTKFEAKDLSDIIDTDCDGGEILPEIIHISEQFTQSGIIRLYGQFEEVNGESSKTVLSPEEKRVKELLAGIKNPDQIPERAIYETLLYYKWGIFTGKRNGIGVGLEVDHEKYQTLSWHEGWKRGSKATSNGSSINSPLIYARKNRKAEGNKYLKGISLRESWR